MTDYELLSAIVKETKLIKNALKAKKLEIALETLAKRKELIDAFIALEDKDKNSLQELIETFRLENEYCISEMKVLKSAIEQKFNKFKKEKKDVHFANKVNKQYKMAEAFLVGNKFDSKKKFKEEK